MAERIPDDPVHAEALPLIEAQTTGIGSCGRNNQPVHISSATICDCRLDKAASNALAMPRASLTAMLLISNVPGSPVAMICTWPMIVPSSQAHRPFPSAAGSIPICPPVGAHSNAASKAVDNGGKTFGHALAIWLFIFATFILIAGAYACLFGLYPVQE
jgi:hypothetical protein